MTVNQRLKQYIDSKGINQIELSRLCHISAAAVSSWFNSIQKKIPSERLIQIIIEYRDLDPRWLLIGEGEMTIGESDSNVIQESKSVYWDILSQLRALEREFGSLEHEFKIVKAENEKLKGKLPYSQEPRKRSTG